jgi:hypothetical protein
MIERKINMEKKMNIEELEKQCLQAEEAFKTLHEQLVKARKEEEEAKQEKLRAEKENRYKEVIGAYENFEELRGKYVNDYGSFSFTNSNSDGYSWFFNSIGVL